MRGSPRQNISSGPSTKPHLPSSNDGSQKNRLEDILRSHGSVNRSPEQRLSNSTTAQDVDVTTRKNLPGVRPQSPFSKPIGNTTNRYRSRTQISIWRRFIDFIEEHRWLVIVLVSLAALSLAMIFFGEYIIDGLARLATELTRVLLIVLVLIGIFKYLFGRRYR